MASLEMVTVINLPSVDSPTGMNVTLRGILPVGIKMRDDLKLQDGRWFQAGQREVVVGKSIAKRYPGAQMGKKLRFGRGEWEVVGVMDGGQSAVNSEIFGDLNQISSDFNRADGLSSVLLRATDAATVPALINSLNDDRRLAVLAETEKAYYEAQTNSGALLQYLGIFISIIMAVGSSFAAMNTMYAAVARRASEIGTLRVLGFSRGSILLSFLLESLLLSALGGLLGCLLVLPLNNITTGIGSFVTFSEIAFNFRVSPEIMADRRCFCAGHGSARRTLPGPNGGQKGNPDGLAGDLIAHAQTRTQKSADRPVRSARTHEPSPWAVRWIIAGIALFVLLGAARFIYAQAERGNRSGHRSRARRRRRCRAAKATSSSTPPATSWPPTRSSWRPKWSAKFPGSESTKATR